MYINILRFIFFCWQNYSKRLFYIVWHYSEETTQGTRGTLLYCNRGWIIVTARKFNLILFKYIYIDVFLLFFLPAVRVDNETHLIQVIKTSKYQKILKLSARCCACCLIELFKMSRKTTRHPKHSFKCRTAFLKLNDFEHHKNCENIAKFIFFSGFLNNFSTGNYVWRSFEFMIWMLRTCLFIDYLIS